MKILFAATPLTGHVNPLLALARLAADRGDEILFVTGAGFEAKVRIAGFRFAPLIAEGHLEGIALGLGGQRAAEHQAVAVIGGGRQHDGGPVPGLLVPGLRRELQPDHVAGIGNEFRRPHDPPQRRTPRPRAGCRK